MTSAMSDIGSFRKDGPSTMVAGAFAVAPKLPKMRDRILALFTECGDMTDAELTSIYSDRFGYCIERSVGTRRRELVDARLLTDTGKRKLNPHTGVHNIVWGIKKSEHDGAGN